MDMLLTHHRWAPAMLQALVAVPSSEAGSAPPAAATAPGDGDAGASVGTVLERQRWQVNPSTTLALPMWPHRALAAHRSFPSIGIPQARHPLLAVPAHAQVVNALGGGLALDMAVKAANAQGVKLIPWVGVAALVHSSRAWADDEGTAKPSPGALAGAGARPALPPPRRLGGGGAAAAEGAEAEAAEGVPGQGRAFCFLPLPVRTGLPVHVNAFFELSSNRRDIWCAPDSLVSFKRPGWHRHTPCRCPQPLVIGRSRCRSQPGPKPALNARVQRPG